MLKYEFIPKNLIVSRTARTVYRTAAVFSCVLAAVILFDDLLPPRDPWTFALVRILVFLGVIGTATTLVAMEFFLLGFSEPSSAIANVFWFLMLLLVPIGPAFYCLVVYSRSKHFREQPQDSAMAASMPQ